MGELCAGAVAAFHGGHQAASHDRPAMAAKLKELGSGDAIESLWTKSPIWCDRRCSRSAGQRAGGDACGAGHCTAHAPPWAPPISKSRRCTCWSRCTCWAHRCFCTAFTGCCCLTSSIIAGWTENWFVLARMDSAIQYNPHHPPAGRCARGVGAFLRENISGFAITFPWGSCWAWCP